MRRAPWAAEPARTSKVGILAVAVGIMLEWLPPRHTDNVPVIVVAAGRVMPRLGGTGRALSWPTTEPVP